MLQSAVSLINHLSSLDKNQLEELLALRWDFTFERVESFFDLAKSLLTESNTREAIKMLSDKEIDELLHSNLESLGPELKQACRLGLIGQIENRPFLPRETRELILDINLAHKTQQSKSDACFELTPVASPQAFFETQKMLMVLSRFVEGGMKLKASGGFRKSDLAELSLITSLDASDLDRIGGIISRTKLFQSFTSLSSQLQEDLKCDHIALWFFIARSVFLHPPRPLLGLLEIDTNVKSVCTRVLNETSLLPQSDRQEIVDFYEFLETFSITADGKFTSAARETIFGNSETAVSEIRKLMPSLSDGFYIQPDFSIIAPGPLRFSVLLSLFEISKPVTVGLASSFQVDKKSLQEAAKWGWAKQQILEFLHDHSLSGVPQPLSYLVEEVYSKNQMLSVSLSTAGFTTVTAGSELLSKELQVDPRLKNLYLRQQAPNETTVLISSVSKKYTENMLSHAGYNLGGESELRSVTHSEPTFTETVSIIEKLGTLDSENVKAVKTVAERLISAGKISGSSELTRILEIAKRNRQTLQLQLSNDSHKRSFHALPVAISGTRLRLIDTVNELERVVPISAIQSIKFEASEIWRDRKVG